MQLTKRTFNIILVILITIVSFILFAYLIFPLLFWHDSSKVDENKRPAGEVEQKYTLQEDSDETISNEQSNEIDYITFVELIHELETITRPTSD